MSASSMALVPGAYPYADRDIDWREGEWPALRPLDCKSRAPPTAAEEETKPEEPWSRESREVQALLQRNHVTCDPQFPGYTDGWFLSEFKKAGPLAIFG